MKMNLHRNAQWNRQRCLEISTQLQLFFSSLDEGLALVVLQRPYVCSFDPSEVCKFALRSTPTNARSLDPSIGFRSNQKMFFYAETLLGMISAQDELNS